MKDKFPEGYPEPETCINWSIDLMGTGQEGNTVYDFTFSKESCGWIPWTQTIAPLEIPDTAQFADIIVPSADSASYSFLLDTAVRHCLPVLLVGPTGTGKSVYISRYLVGLPKDKWQPVFITLSARTSGRPRQK